MPTPRDAYRNAIAVNAGWPPCRRCGGTGQWTLYLPPLSFWPKFSDESNRWLRSNAGVCRHCQLSADWKVRHFLEHESDRLPAVIPEIYRRIGEAYESRKLYVQLMDELLSA